MDRLAGGVTPEGSSRFADRALARGPIPPEHFRRAPGGLRVSSLGLGTYLGRADPMTDIAVEQAVSIALSSGRTNVLDTAINYRDQRAERSIGRALRRLIDRGTIARDEVVVATKNGYLAPDGESSVPRERYVETELIGTGRLRRSDIVDGSHAMSPEFLTDQFERSRSNLGLETIDLLYLHNAPDAQLPVVGRTKFRERLTAAFELYEGFRADGRLGAYGLATWDALRSPRSAASYLSVAEVVGIAREVGGPDHGLRFLQFPFNLALPEAALLANQVVDGTRRPLFEAAERLGLGCFTSIPLLQGRLAVDGPRTDGLTRAQSAIQFARSAPGSLAALIGQKSAEHVAENLKVAEIAPWSPERFRAMLEPAGPSGPPR